MDSVAHYFSNFGFIIKDLPSDLLVNVRKEISDILDNNKNNNKILTSGLSGKPKNGEGGIPIHYYIDQSYNDISKFILECVNDFESEFDYFSTINIINKDLPLIVDRPWVNLQKKTEFIPSHIHDGILSYTFWIQIPYNIDEEMGNGNHCGTFYFDYRSILGTPKQHKIPIDKSFEGKCMMFPSTLSHTVYPFYTSEDLRISVSGNVKLDALSSSN